MVNIWDEHYVPPPWAQQARRLSTRAAATGEIAAALGTDARTAGRLADIRREASFEQAASTFFSATWRDNGTPTLVKLNVSPQELHWMRSLGETTTNLVPPSWRVGRRSGATTCAG